MEKTYLQLNLVNILTIGFIFIVLYTFSGTIVATLKTYLPNSGS